MVITSEIIKELISVYCVIQICFLGFKTCKNSGLDFIKLGEIIATFFFLRLALDYMINYNLM